MGKGCGLENCQMFKASLASVQLSKNLKLIILLNYGVRGQLH